MNDFPMDPMGGPGGPGGPGGGPPAAGYTEKRPETDWVLTESVRYPEGVVLYAGHLPAAPEGRALLMTVNGVPTTVAPGVYPGKVELTVYDLTHIPREQAEMSSGDFRIALHVQNGALAPTGLEFTAGDYKTSDHLLEHVSLTTNLDDFNGVFVTADQPDAAPFVIRNSVFRGTGGGNSEGRGASVTAVGSANVKLDQVEFWNSGTLTAVMASGRAQVEVANSVIYGARDFTAGKLCPWVLGINGSNRLTNAIDEAKVHYHDSIVVAESWAALSTDAGRGVRLVGENLFSGIGRLEPYQADHAADYTAVPELNGKKYGFYLGNSAIGECGYINYADTGFHNSFRDVTFYSPDYIFILSTGQASIDVSGDSQIYSGRFGVLLHKNQGGTVSFQGGKVHAERALFLVKSWSETDPDGCFCHMICDGTDISVGEGGAIYQLMTSDDVGLTPGGDSVFTVPELEAHLDQVPRLPETYKTQKKIQGFPPHIQYPVYVVDGEEITVKEDEASFLKSHPTAEPLIIDASNRISPATLTLKNLTAKGDVFNGVYGRIQVLDVTLDNASVTGAISSAYTYHVDASGVQCPAGTQYKKSGREDEHLGIGRVGNTAAPSINNPVHLTLKSGAVWTPVGDSYLETLDWSADSVIHGSVTLDGKPVAGPGQYTGNIVVKP